LDAGPIPGIWAGIFSSCLRSILIFFRKTGARLNFKIELGSLHISPGPTYPKYITYANHLKCYKYKPDATYSKAIQVLYNRDFKL
jgi:hypothetical protein